MVGVTPVTPLGIQGSLRFWIAGTGFQSLSVALRFWIPVVSGIPDLELYSRFQSLGIRDSTSKNFPDSRIRILFNEGLHCGPQIRQKQQKQLTEINITLDYESELVTNNGGIYGLFQEFSLRERRKLKKSAPEKKIEVCMEKGQEISLFFSLSFSSTVVFLRALLSPHARKSEFWNTRNFCSRKPWNLEHS